MKLIKGVIFGVDVFYGLCWYIALALLFWACSFPAPSGYEQVVAVGIGALAAILPDLGMGPHLLIRKGKYTLSTVIYLCFGTLAVAAVFAAWLNSIFFACAGIIGAIALVHAFVYRSRALRLASHWLLWHHPVLVLPVVGALTFMGEMDFAPQHAWYYELLVVPLVIKHFLHNARQPQGFPFFSPIGYTHYRIQYEKPFIRRVSDDFILEHYTNQFQKSLDRTVKQEAEWRADSITRERVIDFIIAALAALGTLLLVP